MAKIICATDFSPAADQAAQIAARLAGAFGDRLELVHVVPRSQFLHPELIAAALRPLVDAAETAVAQRAARLSAAGARVSGRVLVGTVDEGILDGAAEPDTRMVVLGSHGRTGVARLLLGSVAERIVHGSPLPVLVVPEAAVRMRTSPATAAPLVVTAGVDLSPATDSALRWLQSLAAVIPCRVNLVHFYWPPRESTRLGLPWTPGERAANAEVALVLERELRSRVAKLWPGGDVRLRVRPVWGFTPDPLVKEAETDDADLLVVGTRQERGSTAIATLRASSLPVLSIPLAEGAPEVPGEPLAPLRTLLVPIGFGAGAASVVRHACRMLHPAGGTLVLCHVREAPHPGMPRQTGEELEAALLALLPTDTPRSSINVLTFIQESGPAADAILQAARRLAPDAIVMSSGSRSGVARAVLGSTAEVVVRNALVPVTVVPASEGR
jgi:nucleotide-binding universal stress UspA family protein